MADGGDTEAKVRWMTYPEAARALGLSMPLLRDLCLRLGWRRGKRDDGRPWIAVPLVELEREANGSPHATTLDEGYPARVAEAMAALITARNEAESRAEAVALEAAELREQLARTEGEREAARDALRAAEAAAGQASRQAEEAWQQAADSARRAEQAGMRAERAEAARQTSMGMPWWRRLLSPRASSPL